MQTNPISFFKRLYIKSGSNANTKPYTNGRLSFRKGVVEEKYVITDE